ncbi:MAG: hypothetical protein SFT91_03765 [Rickettsiaceae bacterium]|nr:hypothetical protein [Rickettsiaceae bacterium]
MNEFMIFSSFSALIAFLSIEKNATNREVFLYLVAGVILTASLDKYRIIDINNNPARWVFLMIMLFFTGMVPLFYDYGYHLFPDFKIIKEIPRINFLPTLNLSFTIAIILIIMTLLVIL